MPDIATETVIIGAGQAGVPLARALADAGRPVVLIEREHLGGSCVNFGCTPTKALIASARAAADARRAAALGIIIPRVEVDFPAVMGRVRHLVVEATGELDRSFATRDNPRLLRGHARFDGRDGGTLIVHVGDSTVRAERAVIDTGTSSVRPPIEGLSDLPTITAENWPDLHELPRSLIMLGGSYIGLEMAQAFQRLGSRVTLLEQGDQLAPREDPDVAAVLLDSLRRDGCDVRLGAEVRRAVTDPDGVRLHLSDGSVAASRLFLAVGRAPNTNDLGLETIGLATDKTGHVRVDDHLASNVPGVWAAGDVHGGPAFTHTAYDDFRALCGQFLGDGKDTRCRVVPYAVFTDPELGRVGISETEAREAGRRIKVGRLEMRESGRAREDGRTEGFIKVVIDAETDMILGVAALCEHGAEVAQIFIGMMNAGWPRSRLRDAVHIHPTLAEAAKNAALHADG